MTYADVLCSPGENLLPRSDARSGRSRLHQNYSCLWSTAKGHRVVRRVPTNGSQGRQQEVSHIWCPLLYAEFSGHVRNRARFLGGLPIVPKW